MFSSSLKSKSRLVAILINKHLPLSNFQSMSVKSGRYVKIKDHLHGQWRHSLVISSHVFPSFSDKIGEKADDFSCYFFFIKDNSSLVQNPMSIKCACIHGLIHILYCWSKNQ